MSGRQLIIASAFALCLGTGFAVIIQQHQLLSLRGQQAAAAAQTPAAPATSSDDTSQAPVSQDDGLPELLKLRSEVTRLSARKRELSGVEAEAEQLKAQLAMAQTNGNRLPPGFIRKTEAQMVGFSTPENTLQTFLYAIQHRDAAVALQAVTPSQAERLRERLDPAHDPENGFFKRAGAIPGFVIQGRQTLADGSVELQVSAKPGEPAQGLRFQQVAGEWKLDEAF